MSAERPESIEWTADALKVECRRLASLRDRAMEDAERAEAELEELREENGSLRMRLAELEREQG